MGVGRPLPSDKKRRMPIQGRRPVAPYARESSTELGALPPLQLPTRIASVEPPLANPQLAVSAIYAALTLAQLLHLKLLPRLRACEGRQASTVWSASARRPCWTFWRSRNASVRVSVNPG